MKRYIKSSTNFWGADIEGLCSVFNANLTIKDVFDLLTTCITSRIVPEISFSTSYRDSSPYKGAWISFCGDYSTFVRELTKQCGYRMSSDDRVTKDIVDYILGLKLPIKAEVDDKRSNLVAIDLCDTDFVYGIDEYKFHIRMMLYLESPFFGGCN